MKTISLLALGLIVSACATQQQTVAPEVSQPETTQAEVPSAEVEQKEEQKKEPSVIEQMQQIDSLLTEARDPIKTAGTYSFMYMRSSDNNPCADGYMPLTSEEAAMGDQKLNETVQAFQVLSDPKVKFECFVKSIYSDTYMSSSDECIIARRKTKQSTVCYYNYKKYLPTTSKITSDADFLYLVSAFNTLYGGGENTEDCVYCSNLTEKTTAEKAECAKKAKNFMNQIVTKTVPLCKNTVKKEYTAFLKEGISNFAFLSNMTKAEINSGTRSPTKAFLLNGIYSSAYETAWEKSIEEFGITHFCSVKGYKQDIVNINNSSKKKSNKVVSLN